jgi:chloramphenicol-sensitive protein RarD
MTRADAVHPAPPNATPAQDDAREVRIGIVFAVAAYAFWGLIPLYFKAVRFAPAYEVLAHRIVWSFVFLGLLLTARNSLRDYVAVFATRRTIWTLALTASLIACNWLGFIWAVNHDQVRQASLGYFINPLVYVLLGFIFLRERLRRVQIVSVILAAIGVTYLTIAGGEFPALALMLAFTFGFYGLLRKTTRVGTIVGLAVETTILLPAALLYFSIFLPTGETSFGHASWEGHVLLVSAGVVTSLPLLWFAAGARRLTLATIGFLQYLAPTGHFLVALAYGEQFTIGWLVAFVCIWIALAIYTTDMVRRNRQQARAARGAHR